MLSSAESESIASQPNIQLHYYLYTQKLCNIYDKPLLSIEITQLIINWLCKKKYLIGSAALSQFWLLNLTQLIMMVFLFFEMRNSRLINGQQMAIIIEEICVYNFLRTHVTSYAICFLKVKILFHYTHCCHDKLSQSVVLTVVAYFKRNEFLMVS